MFDGRHIYWKEKYNMTCEPFFESILACTDNLILKFDFFFYNEHIMRS